MRTSGALLKSPNWRGEQEAGSLIPVGTGTLIFGLCTPYSAYRGKWPMIRTSSVANGLRGLEVEGRGAGAVSENVHFSPIPPSVGGGWCGLAC